MSNILDKRLLNDEYETVDEHFTNGDVGSRKRVNVREHLFVLNAIMSASKEDKQKC